MAAYAFTSFLLFNLPATAATNGDEASVVKPEGSRGAADGSESATHGPEATEGMKSPPPARDEGLFARRAGQVLLGGLMAGGLAYAGFWGAALVSCAINRADGWCIFGGILGIWPGAALGAALGVYLAGLPSGRGTFLAALAGAAAGAVVGLGLMPVLSILAAAAPVAGAMIGYAWAEESAYASFALFSPARPSSPSVPGVRFNWRF